MAAPALFGTATGTPNWWTLIGLIYLGFGLIGYAGAVIGGSQWNGSDPSRRIWAAGHQAYGTVFSALLTLLGLLFIGIGQFAKLSMGPMIVSLLMLLIVLCLAYVLLADRFDAPIADQPVAAGHAAAVTTGGFTHQTAGNPAPQHHAASTHSAHASPQAGDDTSQRTIAATSGTTSTNRGVN